jgi:hypothetical protein
MKKFVKITLTSLAMVGMGIGAAQAANYGSFVDITVTGAKVTNGNYSFTADQFGCVGSVCRYYDRVSGRLQVTGPDAHLQVRPESYAYKTIFNEGGTYAGTFSKTFLPGDLTIGERMTVQLCHERPVIADECKSVNIYR